MSTRNLKRLVFVSAGPKHRRPRPGGQHDSWTGQLRPLRAAEGLPATACLEEEGGQRPLSSVSVYLVMYLLAFLFLGRPHAHKFHL